MIELKKKYKNHKHKNEFTFGSGRGDIGRTPSVKPVHLRRQSQHRCIEREDGRDKNHIIELKKNIKTIKNNELTLCGGRGDTGRTPLADPAKETMADLERAAVAEGLNALATGESDGCREGG